MFVITWITMNWFIKMSEEKNKMSAKRLMEELMFQGITNWNELVLKLKEAGVDTRLLGWLHAKYQIDMSGVIA